MTISSKSWDPWPHDTRILAAILHQATHKQKPGSKRVGWYLPTQSSQFSRSPQKYLHGQDGGHPASII
ncbi:hypothetical protein SORBI_3002G312550 [Sorghum bicolor]|uniref:Uncharacterized protein n=1 Tax=Sorghum bicolor TaxID=4558 RepID=A0A1W0W6F1_SORBI|nr:hypothetical protein SORBI_3002G312550 [Sorghum bicolor]